MQNELKETFTYNSDGSFTRLKSSGSVKAGDVTFGTKSIYGYRSLRFNNKQHPIHRLIWVYHYGDIPEGHQIDHINGIRDDNKIENLRVCTRFENQQNRSVSKNNKCGYIGVRWVKRLKKWRAQITYAGKYVHLGYFVLIDDAIQAYLTAKQKYHTFNPTVREC